MVVLASRSVTRQVVAGGLLQAMFLLAAFAAFEAVFLHCIASVPWSSLDASVVTRAVFYVGIYTLVFCRPLLATTLVYLLLPYVIFSMGWLKPWLGGVFLLLLFGCAWQAYRTTSVGVESTRFLWERISGFCLIIAWVHLAGAGGIGYQVDDYNMHNGRLRDLVEYAWPVRYGDNQNLVYYIGYYLPAAALGKWLGFAAAYKAMYYWTLLGVGLVFRWVLVLTGIRWAMLAALLLIFFGGLDVLGYWVTEYGRPTAEGLWVAPKDALLDFWMLEPFGTFIGAYPSNTFQLYWSPHQVIAGWLCAALLLHAAFQGHYRSAGFFYALLALWAPLVMVAALPVFLMLLCCRGVNGFLGAFSWPGLLGGVLIVPLFAAFYFSGSAGGNPYHWLWQVIPVSSHWQLLLLFYAASWGVLVLLLMPAVWRMALLEKRAFLVLSVALLLISFVWYGLFSDMMVRGSSVLMFMLMVYTGKAWLWSLRERRWGYGSVLFAALLLSAPAGYWNMHRAWSNYGLQRAATRAPDHPAASQFLGPDRSFFLRYLAADQP